MKIFTIILGVIGALAVISGIYNMTTSKTNQNVPEHVRQMFISWKSEHQRGYGATAEESFRLQVFYDNYKKVNAQNAKGGATFALNQFADLSLDEFRIGYMGYKHEETQKQNVKLFDEVKQMPYQVDWEAMGAVNRPQQQDKCGGCYAFSTTGALEGLAYIITRQLLQLSKQQIISCSKGYGINNGCSGGTFEPTFTYTAQHGMVSEAEYPYQDSDAYACDQNIEARGRRYNTSYAQVQPQSNMQLMAALSQQPVSVAVDADDMQFYTGGVFVNDCREKLNHAVLAVGYGIDAATGKGFYKVKNSWGTTWGQGGFIYLERFNYDGPGKCGVLMNPVYPTWTG